MPELVRTSRGIVNLYERRRVRLFAASRPVPALLLLPAVRAARPLQHAGARAHRAHPARGAGRRRPRVAGADLRVGAGAAAHAGAHRPRARASTADVERIERRITETLRTWADQLREELHARLPAETRRRARGTLRGRVPGRLPGRRARRREAIGDLRELAALADAPHGARHGTAPRRPRRAARCTCACTGAASRSRCPTCCRCSRTSTCAS